MANQNIDIIRLHDTPANLTSNLRNKMFAFDSTNNRLAVKTSTGTMVYFDNNTVTGSGFLKLDGTNSPTATIDWDGQDLDGVNVLSVNSTSNFGDSMTVLGQGQFSTGLSTSGDFVVDTDLIFADVSTSYVGIGTSTPGYELQVVGASNPKISAKETASSSIGRMRAHGSGFSVGTDTSDPMFFYINDAEVGRFDTSGNLGIGTNSPGYKLDVNGSFSATSGEFSGVLDANNGLNISGTTTGIGSASFSTGLSTNGDFSVDTDLINANTTLNYVRMGASANYTEIEDDGFVEYNGDARAWEDLRIVPGAFQFVGTSDPTLRAWQPGGSGTTFQIYCFSQSDEVFFTCQIPHGYAEGTDLKPHLHWTPRQFGSAESGNTVAWKLDYSIQDVGAAFGSSSTIDLSDACTGTNHYHEITSSGTISGTGLEISAMLVGRLYRDTTGDTYSTTVSESPGILEFDIHYQINTPGSRSETTK